jgi:hypothetical protein
MKIKFPSKLFYSQSNLETYLVYVGRRGNTHLPYHHSQPKFGHTSALVERRRLLSCQQVNVARFTPMQFKLGLTLCDLCQPVNNPIGLPSFFPAENRCDWTFWIPIT